MKTFALALVFAAAVLGTTRYAQAGCEGCVVKEGRIVLPNFEGPSSGEVSLAWDFKGAQGVDYERMLADADYSREVFDRDANFSRVANYLVDAKGRVLAEIPSTTEGDGAFLAKGISPNHRGWSFLEDAEQGMVVYSFSWRWYTDKLIVYKILGSGDALQVAPIAGAGLEELQTIYLDFLDRKFGTMSNYRRDRSQLAITYSGLRSSALGCKEKGMDLCLTVEAGAYIPKSSLEDTFSNDVVLELGIRLNGTQGELQLLDSKDSSI